MDELLFSRTLAVHEAGTLLQEVTAAVAAGREGVGAPLYAQLAPAAELDGGGGGGGGARAAPEGKPPPPAQPQPQLSAVEALADLFAPAPPAPQLTGGVFEGAGGEVSPVVLPRPTSGAPLLPPPPAAATRVATNPLAAKPAAPALADPFAEL
jgi:hypothetical protein